MRVADDAGLRTVRWPRRAPQYRQFPHRCGTVSNHPPLLTRCGATRLAERIARNGEAREGADIAHGRPDGWLDHGDVIPLRDGALEVIATPGHTRGHVVFRHTDTRILFSGDHILPRLTPSIGFEWAPEPYPLRSYLRSLELVRGLPTPHCCLLTAPSPPAPAIESTRFSTTTVSGSTKCVSTSLPARPRPTTWRKRCDGLTEGGNSTNCHPSIGCPPSWRSAPTSTYSPCTAGGNHTDGTKTRH
ncbi:MBL fold metallo-hydrolase [Rhodococcus sp. WB9]|nr:MBL fold metallo-hydrolase [Rhodococcus sp. WB9]